MKYFFSSIIFLLVLPVSAQKVTQDIFEAGNVEKIVLSSDEIFRINVTTGSSKEIKITSRTEGEYYNAISLDADLRKETLVLSSRYREILQNGYDKLSAHKVFSMEVELELPEGMLLEINSNLATVYLLGNYKAVLVQLRNGSCFLQDFTGDAVINTYDGNIYGTVHDVTVEASTRFGKIDVPQKKHGSHKLVLTSIKGEIKLSETK